MKHPYPSAITHPQFVAPANAYAAAVKASRDAWMKETLTKISIETYRKQLALRNQNT